MIAPRTLVLFDVDGTLIDSQVHILEAMKMENVIKAPTDVTIQKINVLVGDNVEKNQTLIEF